MSGGGTEIRRGRIRRGRSVLGWVARHPDHAALLFLALVGTALVAIPAFGGVLVLPGDDLFQNEPLRVLSGSILRSGRLPAWDPLIWSGTPLLAGWNAGSMFPGTWLFALLPAGLAWTINLALAYVACATGVHLLLRRIGVRTVPALLGALLFTYTGFMNGQIVHIGLVQGTAFTPWLLLAIEWMMSTTDRRDGAQAVALCAGATALIVLAGDPRAVTSAAVVAGVWILARIIHGVGRSRSFALLLVAGGALGTALSAIQWIPGIGFLHSSQRATAALSFFSAGSLDFKSLSTNLLVPFLVGGNGNFGLPVYAGGYNLPEVTIGVGLVALVATGAYLPTLIGSVRTRLASRTASDGHRLGTAYGLIVLGTVLTLGGKTPLGNLLVHIPLYGGERLQNRNAVIFDFGLAMLVSFLVDDLLTARTARESGATDPAPGRAGAVLRSWPSVVLGAIAPAGTVALIAWAYTYPSSLAFHLGVVGTPQQLFSGLAPYLVPTLGFAAILFVFVVLARFLSHRIRAVAMVVFVLVDLLTYLLSIGLFTVPTTAVAARTVESAQVNALTGPNGRSALYNASFESFGNDPLAAEKIGVTDLNVLRNEPSVQGYGSIVNSGYETATNTHLFGDLAIDQLDGSTFDILNLSTLLTLSGYLDIPIPGGQAPPIALDHGKFTNGKGVAMPPPGASGPYPIANNQPATFYLDSPRYVRVVTIYLNTANGGPTRLRVTALGPHGQRVVRIATVIAGRVRVRLPASHTTTQFDVEEVGGLPGEIGGVLVVTSSPGERLVLDGALQDQLTPPHWSYQGNLGPLTAFKNNDARGPAWLESASGVRSPSLGSVKTISTSQSDPTVMAIDAPRGAVLVRSEEYAHGWTARLHPVGGGRTIVLPVDKDGLVQKVTVPAGRYTVTWRYAPTGLLVGLVLTAIGFLFFLGLVVVSLRARAGIGTITR